MTRSPIVLAAASFALCGASALGQDNAPAVAEAAAPDEVQQLHAANKAMADFARQQVADNEAKIAAHRQAQAAYEAELARVEAARQAREADMARTTAEHEAAVAKWRADIAACKDGDASRCPATAEAETGKKPGLLKRLLPF